MSSFTKMDLSYLQLQNLKINRNALYRQNGIQGGAGYYSTFGSHSAQTEQV